MTPNEFKAWFDGFTEAFEGRIPTKAQWGRIKDRVATCGVGVGASGTSYAQVRNASSNQIGTGGLAAFNSVQAMNDLGRADAKALAS